MIALRQDGRVVVRVRKHEFAPETDPQLDKEELFDDLRQWGLSSTDIALALDVTADRVRNWRTRPYRIPSEYWHALVRLHAAASEAVNKAHHD